MISSINYFRPKNENELIDFLSQEPKITKIIAGGTDIIPGIHQGSSRFIGIKNLVDINFIDSLKKVSLEKEKVIIGSNCNYTQLENNGIIKNHVPLLSNSSSLVGSPQIRNRGTIVGNIVNCAPCADSLPVLLVYDASLKIISKNKERTVKVEELLINPYKAKLESNEIVKQIEIPVLKKVYLGKYYKLGRRQAVNVSRLTYAVLLLKEDDIIKDLRIACGAITPISKRFYEIEKYAKDKKLNDSIMKEIAILVGKNILETTGYRWSSDYKLPVAQQTLYQLLKSL